MHDISLKMLCAASPGTALHKIMCQYCGLKLHALGSVSYSNKRHITVFMILLILVYLFVNTFFIFVGSNFRIRLNANKDFFFTLDINDLLTALFQAACVITCPQF